MRLVGLTGGIATGKSTVSHFLAAHQVPIVDADLIARDIVRPGEVAFHAICDAFGPAVLDADGSINRQRLGALVFGNADQRRKLNSITHPYIRIEMLKSVLRHFMAGARLCVLDTPLLFEAGLHRWVHAVVVVYCPDGLQKERLVQRDGLSPLQAQLRIDSQMPIERKKAMAHFVIDNSSSLTRTRTQVDDLIDQLMPSRWLAGAIWGLLLLPASSLYLLLVVFQRIDRWRRLGFFGRGLRPAGIASNAGIRNPGLSIVNPDLQMHSLAPAAGPNGF
ncbi:Dephospho-CoA kinase cab5 [Polyrhizophydium stewartii]|uniref:Dephospho-CoA kinase cab5 n=1 Tax=Polyrhizophydium stewartii TaxID=2732419 RepID=A0ABR4MYP9_9FUNG|nr:hypothetical protein HK105_004162 [Polyrhizophydium stewartii]